ncbi:allantoate amidohydrolase [Tunturibacter empetritectus]|uniref:Allantoate deiminase n=1 Tax=Tunturiibacter lichenicola TaxID=2051959 RepID=A0A7W8JCD2_9BACT|nr:allantoate amidohydrolase [Edaphobacter lichenicola]MBB5345426.1 allantoate deiminase [Edaphobacter lichenicola]
MPGTNKDCATCIIARCREIATHTEVPGEITRRFLTPPMHAVHALLHQWMEAAGMTVHTDAIGNLRGLWLSPVANAPRLVIGSHLDTVPNAGAFDGILGVVMGITIVEELRERQPPFSIEVIGFSEEEGVRFSKAFLGSLAVAGKLDPETLQRTDQDGVSIAEAIYNYGLDPANLPAAVLSRDAFAYLEFHIEQGPILESEGISLGIVEALVGQTRMQLLFEGHANHAGTTPMHLRHDAMAAAAEFVVAVEAYATAHEGLVATVGKLEASPGVGNVIAGRVKTSLDIRHADDNTRRAAVDALTQIAKTAATRRGVTLTLRTEMEQSAVPLDPHLTTLLHRAAAQAGYPSRRMTSGAGHDAMILAPTIPSTMLFLRSPGGLSHHPDEAVLPQDVEAALATAMEFLALLSPELSDDKTKDSHA